MTVLVGLLPALVMAGGALLSLTPLPNSFRRWIPIITCALAAVALIISARATEPLTLLPPNDALPALSLTLQWNGAALPYGIFLLLVLSGRFLFGMETDARSFVFGALTTAGGALAFFAADNFTTLATAWIFVELGMLTIPAQDGEMHDAAARAFGWNLVAIVAWLTAGMIVSNQASSLRLSEVTFEGTSAFLILIAVWIRGGIYPLHASAPANFDSLGVRVGVPLLLGGYLMTRLVMQLQGAMAFDAEMKILALLAVGASALVVVGQFHGGDALMWVLRAFGATMLLLPFFVYDPRLVPTPTVLSTRIAPALCIWFALGAFATCAFLEIAMRWRSEFPHLRLTLVIWIVALLMVASLPLAPTFWARVGLLASAYTYVGVALWLLLVATMALILVPVWREIFASSQVAPKAPSLFEYAALACVLLPALALSVVPFVFVAPFGIQVQAGSALAYDALFKPTNLSALIFLLAGLGVPLLASFELARRWSPRANLLPTRVTNVLDLTNVTFGLDAVYRFIRGIVQQSLSLLEQPPIAWLIFLVIWVAVWVIGLSS